MEIPRAGLSRAAINGNAFRIMDGNGCSHNAHFHELGFLFVFSPYFLLLKVGFVGFRMTVQVVYKSTTMPVKEDNRP